MVVGKAEIICGVTNTRRVWILSCTTSRIIQLIIHGDTVLANIMYIHEKYRVIANTLHVLGQASRRDIHTSEFPDRHIFIEATQYQLNNLTLLRRGNL